MAKKIKLGDHFWIPIPKKPHKTPSGVVYPECDILINNQKRKIYGKNKIYLNDGDYIQIGIFNPLYERIGVQLELNGEKEERMLVVNPGQKIKLDRFIDTKKKIKFSTYVVDGGDKNVKEAIKKNGSFKLYFWSEKRTQWDYTSDIITICGATNGTIGSSGSNGGSGCSGKRKRFRKNIGIGTTSPQKDYWFPCNSNSRNYNELCNVDGMGSVTSLNQLFTKKWAPIVEETETGRIEKGGKSKQKMRKVDFDPSFVFYTLKYKLLPYSVKVNKKKISDTTQLAEHYSRTEKKPIVVSTENYKNFRNTDHRIYCPNTLCGYRVRNTNWKFCPICGTEI